MRAFRREHAKRDESQMMQGESFAGATRSSRQNKKMAA
jgi:hypothetical protein